jgi:hypothetical protein
MERTKAAAAARKHVSALVLTEEPALIPSEFFTNLHYLATPEINHCNVA